MNVTWWRAAAICGSLLISCRISFCTACSVWSAATIVAALVVCAAAVDERAELGLDSGQDRGVGGVQRKGRAAERRRAGVASIAAMSFCTAWMSVV